MATLNHASSNTDSPAALEKAKVSTHPSQPSENPKHGVKEAKILVFFVSNVLVDLENRYLLFYFCCL